MPEEIAIIALAGMGMVTGILITLIKAVSRAHARKHERQLEGDLPGVDLEEVRHVLSQNEEILERLAEMEERVDFAERLLTRGQGSTLPKTTPV